MASTVISPQEVALNTVRYRVVEPIRRSLASIYPPKMVLGDYTKDSHTRASVITWNNFIGTIGVERILNEGDLANAYEASIPLLYRGHAVIQPKTVATANTPSGSTGVTAISELNGSIYAAWNGGTDVYKYDHANDDWDTAGTPTKLHDLPAAAVSALNFTHSGTEYIAFACTSGFSYSSNGTAWTDDATDALYLAYWDDRLWGIDNVGQLWYSVTIGTEVNDAKLPLPSGWVKSLFVGPDAAGEPILYAGTKTGLWAHDYDNTRWVKTALQYPEHAYGGEGACSWNGKIYVSAGLNVYEYSPQAATIRSVGPMESGAPFKLSPTNAQIEYLAPCYGGFICLINGPITVLDTNYNGLLLFYSGRGWSSIIGLATNTIGSLHISNISSYRAWHGRLTTTPTEQVLYIPLPSVFGDPLNMGTTFDAIGSLILPWFDDFQSDVNKIANELVIELSGPVSTATYVKPLYRTEYTSTYTFTALANATSAGLHNYLLPNSTAPTGIAFNSIQWGFLMYSSGSGSTVSPDIRSISMKYRKKIPARWGFQVEVDLSSEYKGNTPKKLRENLITAVESNTLVEFTYRDDTGATRVYYVDVVAVEGLDRTGHKEKGSVLLTLQEI